MVPIRRLDPIGAIGNYWAETHRPSEREVALRQALADATSVAMEKTGSCPAAESGLDRIDSNYDLCFAFLAHTGLPL